MNSADLASIAIIWTISVALFAYALGRAHGRLSEIRESRKSPFTSTGEEKGSSDAAKEAETER